MVENSTRLRLRVALKLMAFAAMAAFLLVLISALFSRPGGDRVLPLEVNLALVGVGELLRLDWNGRRIIVLHRDAAMLGALDQPGSDLYDPSSRLDRLPDGLSREHRGWSRQWLVVYGESTDLGCPVDLIPPGSEAGWEGGFRDRCRNGRYDLAGRVYKGQPARRNLEIPPHRIDGDRLILGRP